MTRREIAQKILDTEHYMFKNPENNRLTFEDFWLIRLMREQGYSQRDAFEIWRKISGRKTTLETSQILSIGSLRATQLFGSADLDFLKCWNSSNIDLDKEPCRITSGEVEYIDSLDIPFWEKEFCFVCLCYLKSYKTKNGVIKDDKIRIRLDKLLRYIDATRPYGMKTKYNSTDDFSNIPCANGICTIDEIVLSTEKEYEYIEDEYGNLHRTGEMVEITRTKTETRLINHESGEEVFNFSCFKEVESWLTEGHLTNKRVCINCGLWFNVLFRSKRMMCKDCYGKMRNEKKSSYESYIPVVRQMSDRKCSKCGETFEASSQTQTTLCEKCYREMRSEKKSSYESHIPRQKHTRICEICGCAFEAPLHTRRNTCVACYHTQRLEKSRKRRRKKLQN